ncbi:antibiotic biosynthesis monooxygenase [Thioclava sp. GXIMD4216]|uniref:antibiotic biosynthesis monooxygenase family protein n=1 Tax=Thioclava sp. GXIMD4216 TaxID=3131929 RepID=UPI0030CFF698
MSRFAPLPDPPYHAVIFSSQLGPEQAGYGEMADLLADLAAKQPGYIGAESLRDSHGYGITISYWRDAEAVRGWKQVSTHLMAQKLGKTRWYDHYTLRVACIERQYEGPDGR